MFCAPEEDPTEAFEASEASEAPEAPEASEAPEPSEPPEPPEPKPRRKSPRRRRSPRRARPEDDDASTATFVRPKELRLRVGDATSDVSTTVGDLVNALQEDEATMLRVLQSAKSAGGYLTVEVPGLEVTQEVCDVAMRLLLLPRGDRQCRQTARDLLGEVADAADLAHVVVAVHALCGGADSVVRNCLIHCLLSAKSDGTPWDLLQGMARREAGDHFQDTVLACVLHVAVGLAEVPTEDAAVAAFPSGCAARFGQTLKRVAWHSNKISGEFDSCPAIQYDTGLVKALIKLVRDGAAEGDGAWRCQVCVAVMVPVLVKYEHALPHRKHRKAFQRACESIVAHLTGSRDTAIPWLQ